MLGCRVGIVNQTKHGNFYDTLTNYLYLPLNKTTTEMITDQDCTITQNGTDMVIDKSAFGIRNGKHTTSCITSLSYLQINSNANNVFRIGANELFTI